MELPLQLGEIQSYDLSEDGFVEDITTTNGAGITYALTVKDGKYLWVEVANE